MPSELVIQTVLIPFAAAFLIVGIIGAKWRERAVVGMGLGFLVGYVLILGLPLAPPRSSMHKIFYVGCAATILAAAVSSGAFKQHRLVRYIAAAVPAVIVGWLAFKGLVRLDGAVIIKAAIFAAIGGTILFDMFNARREGAAFGMQFLVAASAMSGLGALAAAGSIAQLAGVYAAALGGFLLWNWPRIRHSFGAAGIFLNGSICFSLAAILLFFSDASPLSVLVLSACFLSDRCVRLVLGERLEVYPALVPVFVAVLSLAPALLALGYAAMIVDDGYGY